MVLKEVRWHDGVHNGAVLVVCWSLATSIVVTRRTLFTFFVVLVMYALVLAIAIMQKVDAAGP